MPPIYIKSIISHFYIYTQLTMVEDHGSEQGLILIEPTPTASRYHHGAKLPPAYMVTQKLKNRLNAKGDSKMGDSKMYLWSD